jgi:hypothetical protein
MQVECGQKIKFVPIFNNWNGRFGNAQFGHYLAAENRFDCRPDVFSFTTVLSAHSRSGSPGAGEKTLQLFSELKALSENDPRNKSLEPNVVTYQHVIVAQIRSVGSSGEGTIWRLVDELKLKQASFWLDGIRARNSLDWIKKELRSSSFKTKNELIEEFERLERTALSKSRQAKQSNRDP